MAGRFQPPNIKRSKPGSKSKLSVVWIFCEGLNTETSYFESFALHVGNKAVQLSIVGGAGVPATIVKKACAKRRELNRDKTVVDDEVWAVFDEDTHPNIGNALEAARQSGVLVAFSSPCFELWGILHDRDHDAPVSSAEAQKLLSAIYSSYDHDRGARLNYAEMGAGYGDAKRRADRMRRKREEEGARLSNPYTDVDFLTEAIAKKGQPEKVEAAAKGEALRASAEKKSR